MGCTWYATARSRRGACYTDRTTYDRDDRRSAEARVRLFEVPRLLLQLRAHHRRETGPQPARETLRRRRRDGASPLYENHRGRAGPAASERQDLRQRLHVPRHEDAAVNLVFLMPQDLLVRGDFRKAATRRLDVDAEVFREPVEVPFPDDDALVAATVGGALRTVVRELRRSGDRHGHTLCGQCNRRLVYCARSRTMCIPWITPSPSFKIGRAHV